MPASRRTSSRRAPCVYFRRTNVNRPVVGNVRVQAKRTARTSDAVRARHQPSSRMAPAAVSTRERTDGCLPLLRRALLRERAVVFLDRLAEALGHLIGAGERQRIVAGVGACDAA